MDASQVKTIARMRVIKDKCDEFWDRVEIITGHVFPTYIRNALKFHGFDGAMSVKLIDNDAITQIEDFAKSGGMMRVMKNVGNLKDFYGPFVDCISEFQVPAGHKKVLMTVAAFIREKGSLFDDNGKRTFQSNERQTSENDYKDSSYRSAADKDSSVVDTSCVATSQMNGSAIENASNDKPPSEMKANVGAKITTRRHCVVIKPAIRRTKLMRRKRETKILKETARNHSPIRRRLIPVDYKRIPKYMQLQNADETSLF